MHTLKNSGISLWFQNRCDTEMSVNNKDERVYLAHRDSYIICKASGDVYTELAGNLIYTTNQVSELPTVGNEAYVNFYDDDTRNKTIVDQWLEK